MTLLQHITSGFRNYANFRGRSTRAEYWSWIAFVTTLMIAVPIAEAAIAPDTIVANLGNEMTLIPRSTLIVSELVDLVTLIPTLAIIVRRFRDAGVSPRWVWLQAVNVPWIALVLFESLRDAITTADTLTFVTVQELHVFWALTGIYPSLFMPTLAIGLVYGIFQTRVTLRTTRP